MALMKMEELFKMAGFSNYKEMELNKFYDIKDKKLYILSYNHITEKKEKKLIESLVYKGESEIYEVVLNDGTLLLKGSEGHNVYDFDKKDYVALGDVESIKLMNSNEQPIDAFVKKTNIKEPILDIQVEDNANYFSNGVLSHNTGGNAIKFYSTTRNRITKIDTLKNKEGVDAGIQMRVRNYKNKAGVPWRDAIMNLWFDGGFNSNDEYFDFFVIFDFIHKGAGGVYTADFLPNGKIRGAEKVKEWIMSDEAKDIYENLKNKVTQKLLGNNELDAENINPELDAETEKADLSKVKVTISELAEQALDDSAEEVSPDLGLE